MVQDPCLRTPFPPLSPQPLNVFARQNPRRHVVLKEIQPNAYNKNLSKTAGVILIFLGVIFSVYFDFFSIEAIIV
jgi:hypothetical protein